MKAPMWAKIGLFYLLSGSFHFVRDIRPLRKLILPYLKRANSWLARFDCLQGRGPIRTYPVDVILQATYRCNLSCPMCFRQTMMADQFPALNALEYTPEDFQKIADELFPYAYSVNLSIAGEPFLFTQLEKAISLLDKYQCKLEANTNMTPLTSDKLMDKVLPHLSILIASIDGATKETFEKIRKGAKFEPVVRALERFGQKRLEIPGVRPVFAFNVTIQKDNVKELPEIVALAHRVKADYISGDYILTYGEEMADLSPLKNMDTYRKYYQLALEKGRELGIECRFRSPEDPHMSQPEETPVLAPGYRMECPYLWTRVVINPNGCTYACCHPEPPLYGENGIQQFWSVWNGQMGQKLRSKLQEGGGHPSCKDCRMKYPVYD